MLMASRKAHQYDESYDPNATFSSNINNNPNNKSSSNNAGSFFDTLAATRPGPGAWGEMTQYRDIESEQVQARGPERRGNRESLANGGSSQSERARAHERDPLNFIPFPLSDASGRSNAWGVESDRGEREENKQPESGAGKRHGQGNGSQRSGNDNAKTCYGNDIVLSSSGRVDPNVSMPMAWAANAAETDGAVMINQNTDNTGNINSDLPQEREIKFNKTGK
jgi:hypothetical protein